MKARKWIPLEYSPPSRARVVAAAAGTQCPFCDDSSDIRRDSEDPNLYHCGSCHGPWDASHFKQASN